MRVCVIGDCTAATVLRGYLAHPRVGFVITETLFDWQVSIEEHDQDLIIVDGSGSGLEHAAQRHIAALTKTNLLLHRQGGVQDERCVKVTLNPKDSIAVEKGLLRALLEITHHGVPRAPEPPGGDAVSAALPTVAPAPATEVLSPGAFAYLTTIQQLLEKIVRGDQQATVVEKLGEPLLAIHESLTAILARDVNVEVVKAITANTEDRGKVAKGLAAELAGLGEDIRQSRGSSESRALGIVVAIDMVTKKQTSLQSAVVYVGLGVASWMTVVLVALHFWR